MDKDKYGEVINGPNTYKTIYNKLKEGKSVIIGWTDQEVTHYDILFSFKVYKDENNMLQHGLRDWYLFVSIIGVGAFGFNPDNIEDHKYIGEKLNIQAEKTRKDITKLLQGIMWY